MNKKLRNITQEVLSNKNLQENIPQLLNYLANDYYSYAGVRLALHYYTFYETYLDSENTWGAAAVASMNRLNQIIADNVLRSCTGAEREKAIAAVDGIRRELGSRMNMLTVYTDIFKIYEYVLNRLEYRFKGTPDSVDEVEFSKEILRYIFDSEDNVVINERIREMIGQLPVRITKQKYFDLLKDSINAYLGSDQSSLQTYLYMLRTSAMLYREEGMDLAYPELSKKRKQLAEFDYKNITKQSYNKALSLLQAASLMLETESTVYLGLQEITNEVYAMLLCSGYAGMVPGDEEAAVKTAISIIKETNELFQSENQEELSLEDLDRFADVEGVQEELSYDLVLQEDALFEIEKNHGDLAKSMMLDQLLHILLHSKKLLSNSLFADLTDEAEESMVDEEIITKEATVLLEELEAAFAAQDKVVSRAVIANTINIMPVFFKNHNEVMNYVRYSLERCSDIYEKVACIEIINAIMAE